VLYRWSVLASDDLGLPAEVATILMAKEVERVRLRPGF